MTHAAADSQLQSCNAEALYYGFNGKADPAAALRCAYYQRAHPQPERGDPFYGVGVLTMLYANGKGVPRNYDLAIRFACENKWASDAEMAYRIGNLEQLRDKGAATTHFDLCDDATSGLMEGACASIQEGFADAKRQRELETIQAQWPPVVKRAFPPLQKAENAFIDARTRYEVDLSGTGRAAFALEEERRLRDQFLINLRRFAKGNLPAASSVTEKELDRRLDAAYRKIQKSPKSAWQYSTVDPSGIEKTQQAWVKLRDAWVKFGEIAYPQLSANRIRAQLIRLRLHQLQALSPK